MAWRAARPPAASGARPPIPAGAATADERAAEAEKTLRGFVEAALGADADVECSVVRGTAVNALVTAARDAALLVIGEPRPGAMGSGAREPGRAAGRAQGGLPGRGDAGRRLRSWG